ncbi:MAG: hypothetical protein ACOZBZ_02215 [Patescibacteria group bacterium]
MGDLTEQKLEQGAILQDEHDKPDIFARLPKIKFNFDEEGRFTGYDTPGKNPQRGLTSSNLGPVLWNSEPHRKAFQAYDAVMRCPKVYAATHGFGYWSDKDAPNEFAPIQERARATVGGEITKECERFVQDIIDWTNSHPKLFEDYLREVEEEGEFVIVKVKKI